MFQDKLLFEETAKKHNKPVHFVEVGADVFRAIPFRYVNVLERR